MEVRGTSTVVEMIAPLAVRFDRERVTRSPEGVRVGLRTAADDFVAEGELAWNEVENAQRNDVALLAQEDLRDLWIEVQAGGTSAQVIHRLRRKLLRGESRRARGPTA